MAEKKATRRRTRMGDSWEPEANSESRVLHQNEEMGMSASPLPPRKILAQMLVGNQIQQAIHVAAKLGLADHLRDGPRQVEELARAAEAHPAALRRLLRALASFGIFAEDDDGRFQLTPLADLLRRGVPDSMHAFALWSGGVSYQTFGGLEYSVRSGQPAFEQIHGMEFFAYLARHPEVGAHFDDLMAWNTAPVAAVVAARDFARVGTLVDLGGGRGDLLAAVVKAHPGLRGVLVDHPRVQAAAQRTLQAAGVADRCTFLTADLFTSELPRGDVYLLKSVVHGLDDTHAARLLARCREGLGVAGRLILVEFVLPPGNEAFPGKLMDLLMLVGGHGRERTAEEFHSLLAAASFRVDEIATTRYGYSLLEATAA
jgi:hypothetical protein